MHKNIGNCIFIENKHENDRGAPLGRENEKIALYDIQCIAMNVHLCVYVRVCDSEKKKWEYIFNGKLFNIRQRRDGSG